MVEMVLNTVRMVDFDQAREHTFGDDKSLEDNLAIGIINPQDFKKMNLTPNLHLKLNNRFGEVIVKIKENKKIPQGLILMPVSIWANQVSGTERNELSLKNIKVDVELTKEPILSFKDLIKKIKRP